jgi:rRNA-processing protein FCF1
VHLDLLASQYKIFIDATALMHPGATHVLGRVLSGALRRYLGRVVVPQVVVKQLQALARTKREDIARRATRSLRLIKVLQDQGLMTIGGSDRDPGSNEVFGLVFSTYSAAYNMCLITQDPDLARNIDFLQQTEDVPDNHDLLVLKMVQAEMDGQYRLVPWHPDRAQHQAPFTGQVDRPGIQVFQTGPAGSAGGRPFRVRTRPITWGTTTRASEPAAKKTGPRVGDDVLTARYGRLKLVRQIGSGGEGDIFLTDLGLAAKIYRPDKITDRHVDKLRLMIEHHLSFPGLCWPLDLVLDADNQVKGYVMEAAKGKDLQTTIFTPKSTLTAKFPHLTRADLVRLCLSILEKFDFLHQKNVLVGDVNQSNILVDGDGTVYFVDTDSYQIENYPCPVGTINYTAPEIQGKDFKGLLRTREHEMFALATLLFMILVPGKPPYSQRGGGDPGSNIRRLDFPYAPTGPATGREPAGPWLFIWANLPPAVRRAFYDTFRENKRLSTEMWIEVCRQYLADLEEGKASAELFPNKFPKDAPVSVQCRRCGKTFEESAAAAERLEANGTKPLCLECRREEFGSVVVECPGCRFQFMAKRDLVEEMSAAGRSLFCPSCAALQGIDRTEAPEVPAEIEPFTAALVEERPSRRLPISASFVGLWTLAMLFVGIVFIQLLTQFWG